MKSVVLLHGPSVSLVRSNGFLSLICPILVLRCLYMISTVIYLQWFLLWKGLFRSHLEVSLGTLRRRYYQEVNDSLCRYRSIHYTGQCMDLCRYTLWKPECLVFRHRSNLKVTSKTIRGPEPTTLGFLYIDKGTEVRSHLITFTRVILYWYI